MTLANSSGLTGERIGFLLSEVYLPRFGVLDPRILRSLSWVKRPIDGQPRAALKWPVPSRRCTDPLQAVGKGCLLEVVLLVDANLGLSSVSITDRSFP